MPIKWEIILISILSDLRTWKKVLDLSTNNGKAISKKSLCQPLVVKVGDFNKPGPRSGPGQTSFSGEFSSQSFFSTPTPKGISPFVDHMNIQTNVITIINKQCIISNA